MKGGFTNLLSISDYVTFLPPSVAKKPTLYRCCAAFISSPIINNHIRFMILSADIVYTLKSRTADNKNNYKNMGFKDKGRSLAAFVMTRYPFINALTMLLLLAERAKRETQPPFSATYIYVCVGLFFAAGFLMGFKEIRKQMAVFHSIHLLILAAIIYLESSLGYRYWVKVRMAHRMIGVAGYYLLYAYFLSPKPRRKPLRYIGHALIGIYVLAAAYALLQSPEDKEAFLKFVPGSRPILFVYATLLATIGLCFIPGQFVYDVTQALLVLVGASTLLIDVRFQYWVSRRNMDYWNQIRVTTDSLMILVGGFMYLLSTKKKSLEEERND